MPIQAGRPDFLLKAGKQRQAPNRYDVPNGQTHFPSSRFNKNPDRIFDPGFKFYPAGAVQVNSPVPFSERVDDRCCGI